MSSETAPELAAGMLREIEGRPSQYQAVRHWKGWRIILSPALPKHTGAHDAHCVCGMRHASASWTKWYDPMAGHERHLTSVLAALGAPADRRTPWHMPGVTNRNVRHYFWDANLS